MTVTIILPCKDSSAMVTARNSKMVDLEVELVCLIFCQHLAELFNSQMGRYVLRVCVEFLIFKMGMMGLPSLHLFACMISACLLSIN